MKLTELAKLPGVQPFTPVHEQPVLLPRVAIPPTVPVYEITVHPRLDGYRCSTAGCANGYGDTQAEALGRLILALQQVHPDTPFPIQLR